MSKKQLLNRNKKRTNIEPNRSVSLMLSPYYLHCFSTVSSGINAMACVTIEDFIKPLTKLEESKYTWITKGTNWQSFSAFKILDIFDHSNCQSIPGQI